MLPDLNKEAELNFLNSPRFDQRLEWLMDHEPALVRELFQSNPEKLKDVVVSAVRKSIQLLDTKANPDAVARADAQLCPEVDRPPNGKPLSDQEKKALREWSDNLLPPRNETTD